MELKDKHGWTALMRAAGLGYHTANANASSNAGGASFISVVKRLIEKGAKLNAKNKQGQTALLITCAYGHHSTAIELLQAGADYLVKDIGGHDCSSLIEKIVEKLSPIEDAPDWNREYNDLLTGYSIIAAALQKLIVGPVRGRRKEL